MRRAAPPLLAAADRVEAARRLIAAGADVNAKDAIGDSPFLYAGAEGRNAILQMTLAAGADLNSTNRYGGTALIPAAHHGHVETVKILLATAIEKGITSTTLAGPRCWRWGVNFGRRRAGVWPKSCGC